MPRTVERPPDLAQRRAAPAAHAGQLGRQADRGREVDGHETRRAPSAGRSRGVGAAPAASMSATSSEGVADAADERGEAVKAARSRPSLRLPVACACLGVRAAGLAAAACMAQATAREPSTPRRVLEALGLRGSAASSRRPGGPTARRQPGSRRQGPPTAPGRSCRGASVTGEVVGVAPVVGGVVQTTAGAAKPDRKTSASPSVSGEDDGGETLRRNRERGALDLARHVGLLAAPPAAFVVSSGDGRSPGSRLRAPAPPSRDDPSGLWQRLAAYSCGGSRGLRTAFPFHLVRRGTVPTMLTVEVSAAQPGSSDDGARGHADVLPAHPGSRRRPLGQEPLRGSARRGAGARRGSTSPRRRAFDDEMRARIALHRARRPRGLGHRRGAAGRSPRRSAAAPGGPCSSIA